jgi:hypothetical protein
MKCVDIIMTRFVAVALGEIHCSDPLVRDDVNASTQGGIQYYPGTATKKVSDTLWCNQYNIPRRTFRDWVKTYQDAKRMMGSGQGGKPSLIDDFSMEHAREIVEGLRKSGTPPSTAQLSNILKDAAITTMKRATKTSVSEHYSISLRSVYNYRGDNFSGRKAKAISDARYIALKSLRYTFQPAVVLTCQLHDKSAEQKWNMDHTSFNARESEDGKIVWVVVKPGE